MIHKFPSLLTPFAFLVSGLNAHGQIPGSILQTNGVDIIDGGGNIIRLRGVNLGGWLVMEPWMTPSDSSGLPDEYSIISTLDTRFGVAEEQSLIQTYRQNWITTQDLNNIQAQGLNVMRVPVWWGDFYTLGNPSATPPVAPAWRSDAFNLLDWLVTSASSRGIYTIIDMHGVFGGQSTSDDTGRENQDLYWTSTNDQMMTAQMWSAIATHYKGNADVAGYDLINEPIPPSTSGTSPVWVAYKSLYQTVRAADPSHIIIMEGTWGNWDWSMLPPPSTYGWTNVVYEMHEYQWSGTDSQMIEAGADNQVTDFYNHLSWNVPAYIGEFNAFGYGTATWQYEVNDFNHNDMNWSPWSYKATHGPPNDSWGLYDPTGSASSWPPIPNIQTSSSNAIAADWSQWTTANAFSINTMISPVITASPSSLLAPWADSDIGSVGFSGSASPVVSGTFTVIGSGSDIANDYDAFHYAYIPWNGDGILVARVFSQTNTGAWAKAGVMFRQSLVAGSVEALTAITPQNGCTFQYRNSTNAGTTNNGTTTGFAAPRWVKLVRSGSSFSAYEAPNSLPLSWTQEGTTVSLSMSGSSCAGLAVSAENNSALSTAQFDNVVFLSTPAAWAGNGQCFLSWAGSYASNYVIQRSTVSGTAYIPVATVSGTTGYLDSGLTNGTTYYYVVTGSTAMGDIVNSVQTNVTPGSFLPPSGLTATLGNEQITLNWTAASGAISYIVERSQTAGGTYATVGTVTGATSFTDTTVGSGTTYYYVVQSVDSVGLESAASSPVSQPVPVPAMPRWGPAALAVLVFMVAAPFIRVNDTDSQYPNQFLERHRRRLVAMKHWRVKKSLLVLGFLVAASQTWAGTPGAPTNARIIDNFEQLGVDTATPRFAWVVNASDRGESQTAYEIIVSSSQAGLAAGQGNLWDSGQVSSAQQFGIVYAGASLAPTTQYWWQVRTWDKDGQVSPWSAPQNFVTAFFQAGDWNPNVQWIRNPVATTSGTTSNPPAMFRKEFQVSKPIQHAYLFISGLGQFVASLNGAKIGNDDMDPAWTDYTQTIDYVTFDVTSQIQQGTNALGVMLGNGWYAYTGTRGFGPMMLWGQLHIIFADGTSTDVVTDTSWTTTTSPYTRTEVHGSENYDARLYPSGWNVAGYNVSSWSGAVTGTSPGGVLASQNAPPVVDAQVYQPVNVTNPASGVYVYDFGENMNGQHQITVSGSSGMTVTMLPGESLASNGKVNPSNTKGSIYTLQGGGSETWRLSFSSTGFRYLQLSGVTTNSQVTTLPYVQNVTAYRLSSAAATTGTFSTSSTQYNQIYNLALKTLNNELCSIHIDGPNYERLGWQEVVWISPISSVYQHDLYSFLSKLMRDVRDAQRNDGLCPDIAPNWFFTKSTSPQGIYDDAPAWGASAFNTPWLAYSTYGDAKILQDNYAAMKAYLAYLKSNEINGLITYGLGDWMAPAGTAVNNVEGSVYVLDTRIMAKVATVLGNSADAAFYNSEFLRVQTAYNNAYFDFANARYTPVSQANIALPLEFGIVPAGREADVAASLAKDIATPMESTVGNYGAVQPYHLTVGDIGTTFLWQALGDYDQPNLVQTMIMQPSIPSYLSMINGGETTIDEDWNYPATRSHDHDMYLGIFAWLFRSLGGISSLQPGYAQIQLKPETPTGLSQVSASYSCMYGLISSSWNATAGTWNVTIPVNTTAMVYVPIFSKTSSGVTISESGTTIWQNGAPVPAASQGLFFDHTEPGYVAWIAGSGSYQFAWQGAPMWLAASGANGAVALTWAAPAGALSYNVKRATATGGPYTTIATSVSGATYTDTNVTNGTPYFYVASAQTASGESDNSIEASAIPAVSVTVPNFGFETPSEGTGSTAYQYNPSGASWTFSPQSGITANNTIFDSSNPSAPQGVQVAFLQRTGTISQPLSGFIPGGAYTVTFSAAQRATTNVSGQTWTVTLNGASIAGYAPGQSATAYTDYSATFTAAATTGTLAFVGTDTGGGDNTVFIDNVRITASQPTAPSGLTAVPGTGQVVLNWTAVPNTSSYTVQRSTTSGGPYTTVASGVTGATYTDTTVSNGMSYYYVVSAVNSVGQSTDSAEAHATMLISSAVSIANFGFETPSLGAGSSAYQYNPSGASWSFSPQSANSGAGITGNGSAFTVGNSVAPQGVQVAFLQKSGTISQALSSFVPGVTYTVTFSAAQRVSGGGAGQNQTWNLTLDGATFASFAPGTSATNYQTYSARFTATSTTHTLAFFGTNTNGGDNSIFIDNVSVTAPLPFPPTSVQATAGTGQVLLNWTASSGATGYDIGRSTTSGGPYTTVAAGVTGTNYTDTGVANGTPYYYIVTAMDVAQQSGNSNQLAETPLAVPGGLMAAAGDQQVTLSWNTAAGATSYNVQRSLTSGGSYTTIATGLATAGYTNTGLTDGTTYYYTVLAANAGGQSSNSAVVSATPVSQPAPVPALPRLGLAALAVLLFMVAAPFIRVKRHKGIRRKLLE